MDPDSFWGKKLDRNPKSTKNDIEKRRESLTWLTGKSPVLTMGLRTLTTMSGGRTPAIVAAQLSAALTTFTHTQPSCINCQIYTRKNIFATPVIWEQENNPRLRTHEILVRIRIRGSMPLTNGSVSGSFYFRHYRVAKLHKLAGRYDNPMPMPIPIAGLKLPAQEQQIHASD